MTVWYAIPTANPDRADHCLRAWREMGYRTAVLVDGQTAPAADVVMRVPAYEGYFASVNRLARYLTGLADERDRVTGEAPWCHPACHEWCGPNASIVVTGGDDMFPDPHHSADVIAADFRREFPDLCGVMQPTGDDLPGTDRICGSPWLGRGWIERGYNGTGPMHAGYRQFYGDEELRIVATRCDRLIDRPDLTQRHEHWSRGGKQTDYQKANDRHWAGDQARFVARARERFPGSGVLGG